MSKTPEDKEGQTYTQKFFDIVKEEKTEQEEKYSKLVEFARDIMNTVNKINLFLVKSNDKNVVHNLDIDFEEIILKWSEHNYGAIDKFCEVFVKEMIAKEEKEKGTVDTDKMFQYYQDMRVFLIEFKKNKEEVTRYKTYPKR